MKSFFRSKLVSLLLLAVLSLTSSSLVVYAEMVRRETSSEMPVTYSKPSPAATPSPMADKNKDKERKDKERKEKEERDEHDRLFRWFFDFFFGSDGKKNGQDDKDKNKDNNKDKKKKQSFVSASPSPSAGVGNIA